MIYRLFFFEKLCVFKSRGTSKGLAAPYTLYANDRYSSLVGGRIRARADVTSRLIGAVCSRASSVLKDLKILYECSFDVYISKVTRFLVSDAVSQQLFYFYEGMRAYLGAGIA
jgi:hypothetical protein